MHVRGGGNDEPNSAESHILNITAPSDTIHVRSWDELDNLTADALLGPASGMKLKTYSYECVDTINYSTLIFNIDAVVANADGRDSHISKIAEWSVELVSVEYYPYIEVWPPHDNMPLMYYGKLDRYRNYSDGSRIGPDRFENYGHWQEFYLTFEPAYNALDWGEYESIFPENPEGRVIIMEQPTAGIWEDRKKMVMGHEYLDESGIHIDMGYRVRVNRNAYIKSLEGNVITLESLISVDFDKDFHEQLEGGYGGGLHKPDLIGDLDNYPLSQAYMEATDELTVFNMCKEVPIINRQDTVREVQIIDTGFGLGFHVPVAITEANVSKSGNQAYWGWYYDFFKGVYWDMYKYPYDHYDKYYVVNHDSGKISNNNLFHSSYINIDGRIIDFVDVCKLNHEPLMKICTRTSQGYHYHFEENKTHYGIPIQRKCDAYFDFYDGPAELVYDFTEEDYIDIFEKNKVDELQRQQDTENTRSMENRNMLEGKPSFHIDTRLPVSFSRK